MFSKTSAATAENVPREERRRGKTQVMPLEVVVESIRWTPNWTRRNWFEPRNVVLGCWAVEAVPLGYRFSWAFTEMFCYVEPQGCPCALSCSLTQTTVGLSSNPFRCEGHGAPFLFRIDPNRTLVEPLCANRELESRQIRFQASALALDRNCWNAATFKRDLLICSSRRGATLQPKS